MGHELGESAPFGTLRASIKALRRQFGTGHDDRAIDDLDCGMKQPFFPNGPRR